MNFHYILPSHCLNFPQPQAVLFFILGEINRSVIIICNLIPKKCLSRAEKCVWVFVLINKFQNWPYYYFNTSNQITSEQLSIDLHHWHLLPSYKTEATEHLVPVRSYRVTVCAVLPRKQSMPKSVLNIDESMCQITH